MEKGLKVEGGDRLGKTIIFARTQEHAEYIVGRFDKNYPHYQGKFAQAIHSDVFYAQNLLDNFSDSKQEPTIAVSVDMLDTGVDVPEVVNLVFFKPVYSRVKFNQMIGRGTRLCPNLFAPGEDKAEFLIFDLCSNFEFFRQELNESDPKPTESLTTHLVKARLELSQRLRRQSTAKPEQTELQKSLLDDLHRHVASMERDNFLVRRHLQKVEELSDRNRWEHLSELDIEAIVGSLSKLPNGLPSEKQLIKRFDLLCLKLQLAIVKQSKNFTKLRDQFRDVLHQLESKPTVPMIKANLSLIEEVQSEAWWIDITPEDIEQIRRQLRDLAKFIDAQEQRIVYTDFTDELGILEEVDVPIQQTGFSPYQYRKKVEAYIRDNENHIAIAKLKRNLPLTAEDLAALEAMLFDSEAIENRDRFEQVYGKTLSLQLFIRKLVGLDRNAAKQAFSQYLESAHFNANQIRFVETIIDYLTQNGIMDPGLLYEPPFTEVHHEGLDGVFRDNDADQIIALVDSFNRNVGMKFGAA
ncbi:type I restriction-modification enzyme R subunit C-terminal domain-containing protein [Trichocoleus sp. FACHB-262]|uniref:type I restriction-modification enzyme R subunit C-terminal domain-containing protein n=1 Tax=Trichocoleus sp. FACHB-262 TaxID=2692869 RepID=UPI001F54D442|nr:type I restriction-modification enzyme R subunit C-terminal domain-containing protein [Trichocoleus sp. FACHB-262]